MPESGHRQPGPGRGRQAGRPSQIPKAGWRDILLRVKGGIAKDHVSLVAAGVAYYAMLAIFPAITAAVSIYGLMANPEQIAQQLTSMKGVVPPDAYNLLESQLHKLAATSGGTLSVALFGSVLVSVWSASQGIKALMTAMNIAYEQPERRGFLHYNGLALLMTGGAILFGVVAIITVVAIPALLANVGMGGFARVAINILRWPVIALAILLGLAVLYRYGPSRDQARWRWVTWGSGAATLVWLAASWAFSFYVANFGNYNETYGSVGAVIVLLFWFYISAYVVVLGGELNAEMEHQTRSDTTKGPPSPMGERDAHMADTLGHQP